ncbi:MAG: HTH domain-containing protein, partial [Methanosarcinales archaeon]|nr:HTH domain-containing protein [Methanosarcinales archaeon]
MDNDTVKGDTKKEHTRDGLVKILHGYREAPISGEELGERLGISRAAVNSHINQLREMGYVIDASTKTGYSLVEVPDRLLPVELKARLDGLGAADACIGCDIQYFSELESTNDTAKAIASDVLDGTVVVSEV